MLRLITLFSILALLSACAPATGPRESTGTLIGAGTGALIGSQFGSGEGRLVGVAIGTLAGAMIGQDIGRSLDQADRQHMEQTTQQSLETAPSNRTTTWVNPDSGNRGSVTPTHTFQNQKGQYCREYQQTVTVAGKQQQVYGTACRQPDGSWQISNAAPASPRSEVKQEKRVVVQEPVYVPYFWPFFTSLSFSFGDDDWGHRGHWGHHRGWGHHGHWGWDD